MDALEKKIAFSFGAICFAFLIMTVVTLTQVNKVTQSSRQIQNVYAPSIEANLRLTNALNTSITSLQNLVLAEDDIFLRQRQASWSIIGKMHKQLINYSKHWNNSEQINNLYKVDKDLVLLRQYQDTIEEKAHSKERLLALRMLKEKSTPLAHQIIATLRHISDPQKWEMERTFLQEEGHEQTLTNTAIIFLFLGVVGSVSVGLILTRAVILPLNRTMILADAITKGDYSLENELFDGEEKLDIALRTMTKQLSEKSIRNQYQQEKLIVYNQELKTLNSNLEIYNDELSQFSYRTSHDLRAPLITVRGLADAICEDIQDGNYDEAEMNANNISGHVKKLENLVVDILDLAKAELEVTDKEIVNVKEIVSEIQTRLQPIYIDNNVRIETNIDPSVTFYVSKVRFTQIIENLISNAIKYSDKNKTSQFVKVSTSQNEERNVCIIEDNGVGIPDEFTNRVFNMFERFHPDISYGSGLGMYIIKKHIDKMDGEISFTSSKSGTIFSIELP